MPVYVMGGTDKPLAHLICPPLSLDKGQVIRSRILDTSFMNNISSRQSSFVLFFSLMIYLFSKCGTQFIHYKLEGTSRPQPEVFVENLSLLWSGVYSGLFYSFSVDYKEKA